MKLEILENKELVYLLLSGGRTFCCSSERNLNPVGLEGNVRFKTNTLRQHHEYVWS